MSKRTSRIDRSSEASEQARPTGEQYAGVITAVIYATRILSPVAASLSLGVVVAGVVYDLLSGNE
ncbi:MAG: hypothetical protein HYR63_18720 [Proteobacteria bacterium]|nr:hypothetical protein [Pseudomonadota bacterium]MBI3499429.1 hypothetical protein [Pseudomonadota bacterium]